MKWKPGSSVQAIITLLWIKSGCNIFWWIVYIFMQYCKTHLTLLITFQYLAKQLLSPPCHTLAPYSVPKMQTLSCLILAFKMIYFFLKDKESNVYFKWANRYPDCSVFTSWYSTMGRYNVQCFTQDSSKSQHCIKVTNQVSTHESVSLTLCTFTDHCLVAWVCYAYGLWEAPVPACFAVLFGYYWCQHWHENLCHTPALPCHNSIPGVMCCCWCWCCCKQECRND